jgi:hypothetical protein
MSVLVPFLLTRYWGSLSDRLAVIIADECASVDGRMLIPRDNAGGLRL